jgi:hypothetical protein
MNVRDTVYLNIVTGERVHKARLNENDLTENYLLIPHYSQEQREKIMLAYVDKTYSLRDWKVARKIMAAYEKGFDEFQRVFYSVVDDGGSQFDDWMGFEENQQLLIAKEWCDAHNIKYTLKNPRGYPYD